MRSLECSPRSHLGILGCDCDFYLHTCLDVDDDLFDHLGRRIEINESLVDAHLKHVPGLGSFTTRCFSG